MADPTIDLPLRVVVLAPPEGVAMAMQEGSGAKWSLVAPVRSSAAALVFEFSVRADLSAAGKPPRLLGSFVQGPSDGRFVYINSGAYAGQAGSPWGRRIKAPLTGISREMIEGRKPGERLQAAIAGKGRDGGPAAASVPILPPGWVVKP